jgi:N-acyl amino acid synthase of PEP-CTERM/exosortase system
MSTDPQQPIPPETSSLFMDFASYFDLSLALTPEQRASVYQVRYHVYCEEFGYEPVESFRNGQETDDYDDKSIHCLVTHRATNRPAGCVRLVLVEGEDHMPMEDHAGESIDAAFMSRFSDQRNSICEISRLAVDGDFRRRRGERETRFGATETFQFAEREKRTFPLIAVSLFLASAAAADILGRKHLFAIMEPFLPTILRRTGVQFHRVGEDFDFRGVRAPYYANIEDLVRDAPDELRLCFEVVKQQFAASMFPEQTARKVG